MRVQTDFTYLALQAVVQLFKANQAFGFKELQGIMGSSDHLELDLMRKLLRRCVNYRMFKVQRIPNGPTFRLWFVPNKDGLLREQNSQQHLQAILERQDTRYNGNRNRLRGVLRGGL